MRPASDLFEVLTDAVGRPMRRVKTRGGMTFSIEQYGITTTRHHPDDDLSADEALEQVVLLLVAVGYDPQSVDEALAAYLREAQA